MSDHEMEPEVATAQATPYPDTTPERQPADQSRPWLDAGRSWAAQADRLAAYLEQQRGRRGSLRRWWSGEDPEHLRLTRRSEACRQQARPLDLFTARGWVVWHDRVTPGTRNIIDHLLIGPGGVFALHSIPVIDHIPGPNGRLPGPATVSELDVSLTLLREHIVPALDAAFRVLLPDWQVPVIGHRVLVDSAVRQSFNDVIRPHEVGSFLAGYGALFGPMHVQDIATQLEDLVPLAPLAG